jgi:hypothetical protein
MRFPFEFALWAVRKADQCGMRFMQRSSIVEIVCRRRGVIAGRKLPDQESAIDTRVHPWRVTRF